MPRLNDFRAVVFDMDGTLTPTMHLHGQAFDIFMQKYAIPTQASLNSIMVDGTGMCGACRVTVGGRTRFTCVDGPEFDAHEINFDEMLMRLGGYRAEEVVANNKYFQK